MNGRAATFLVLSGFLSVGHIASPSFLRGQAPPGPIAPATPRPATQAPVPPKEEQPEQPRDKRDLAGSWKLNRDDSDDPRKKMQEARGAGGSSGGSGPHGGGRGGGVGFPFPGGGGGRGPYGGHGGGTRGGQSDEDRQQMQELSNPAASLTIAQKGAEVDLTDDQNRKRVLYTDGRKLQKSKDANYQEAAAQWEGSRLAWEEKGSRGGKISHSLELAPGGKQLYETLHLDSGRGSPVVIRYVYDIVRESKRSD